MKRKHSAERFKQHSIEKGNWINQYTNFQRKWSCHSHCSLVLSSLKLKFTSLNVALEAVNGGAPAGAWLPVIPFSAYSWVSPCPSPLRIFLVISDCDKSWASVPPWNFFQLEAREGAPFQREGMRWGWDSFQPQRLPAPPSRRCFLCPPVALSYSSQFLSSFWPTSGSSGWDLQPRSLNYRT